MYLLILGDFLMKFFANLSPTQRPSDRTRERERWEGEGRGGGVITSTALMYNSLSSHGQVLSNVLHNIQPEFWRRADYSLSSLKAKILYLPHLQLWYLSCSLYQVRAKLIQLVGEFRETRPASLDNGPTAVAKWCKHSLTLEW